MALEKEILARIHGALDNGDDDQQQLYRALLGDLIFRKSQGLEDCEELAHLTNQPEFPRSTRYPILPEIIDSKIRAIVDKMNPVAGAMDDSVSVSDLVNSEAWKKAEKSLTDNERPALRRAFYSLRRSLHLYERFETGYELGVIRNMTRSDLLQFRDIGPVAAQIIMYSVQPIENSNPSNL